MWDVDITTNNPIYSADPLAQKGVADSTWKVTLIN